MDFPVWLILVLVANAVLAFVLVRSRKRDRAKLRAHIAEAAVASSEQQLVAEETRDFNRRLETMLRELPLESRVKYRLADGSEVWVVIKSERLQHKESGAYGWEALFEDDGEIGFADERRVVAAGLVPL